MIGDKEYTDEFLELVKYELQQDLLRNYTPRELRVFERAYNISSLNPIPKIAEKNIELTKQHIVVATMAGKRKRSSSPSDSSRPMSPLIIPSEQPTSPLLLLSPEQPPSSSSSSHPPPPPQQTTIRYVTLDKDGKLIYVNKSDKSLDKLYYWRDGDLRKHVKQYTKESIILFDEDAVAKIKKENGNNVANNRILLSNLGINISIAPHVKHSILSSTVKNAYYVAFQLPEISLYMFFDTSVSNDGLDLIRDIAGRFLYAIHYNTINATTPQETVMEIIQRLFVDADKNWFFDAGDSIDRRNSSYSSSPISFAGVFVTPSHIYMINLGDSTVLLKSDGIKEILNTSSHEINDPKTKKYHETKKHILWDASYDSDGDLAAFFPDTEEERFPSTWTTFDIPDDHRKVVDANTLYLKIKNVEFSINRTRGFGGDFRLKSTDGVNYSDNPIISAKPDVYSFKRSFTDRILIGNKLLFDNFKPHLLEILNDNTKLDLPDTWQGINGNNGERCIAIELHTSCPGILKNKPPSGELSFDTA